MLSLRDAFLMPPGDPVELRAFTHGLMPRTVPAMMQHFVDDWQRLGVDAWNEVPNHWRPESGERVGWWTLPTYLGDTFIAPLLQAPPGTCIMQPNVHWIVQSILSARDLFERGDRIVLTEAEFPSVLHSVQQWADLHPFTVDIVPLAADGFVDRAAVLDAVTDRTALVFLSHVGFTTGELLPDAFLAEVADRVHHYGGLLAVDGYHATGSVPVDAPGCQADLYFGGLLKEGCGSSGNAYVYLRPGLDLCPRTTGWFGDADPFAFAPGPTPHQEIRMRFLGGTTAVASMYHAVEGVRLLLDAGLDTVRRHSLKLTGACLERATATNLPLRSPHDPDRRGAMIILDVPHADRLCTYLKRQNIFTDSRQGRYLRLAPFVWNTMDDVERTFDALTDALQTGAHLAMDEALHGVGPVT